MQILQSDFSCHNKTLDHNAKKPQDYSNTFKVHEQIGNFNGIDT